MKKWFLICSAMLIFLGGCKRKIVKQERICTRIDLPRIVSLFPKSSDEISDLTVKSKQQMDDAIVAISDVRPEIRTYHNTVLAYEQAYFQFFTNQHVCLVLAELSSDPVLQRAAQKAVVELEIYHDEVLSRNVAVYQAFKEYEKFGYDPYRQTQSVSYFLQIAIEQFEHNGMLLPIAQRADAYSLEKEIENLVGRFENNIFYDNCSTVFSPQELAGVCLDWLTTLDVDQSGNYIVPVNGEAYDMILNYCQVEATRKRFYILFGQRAYPQNEMILKDIIAKRQKLAEILGYPNFATYQLQSLMVKTPKKTEAFLWNMVKDLKPALQKEFHELTQRLPSSVQLTERGMIKPWDQNFVRTWYKKHHFDLDCRMISEYFPLDHVISTMLQKFKTFFYIEFEPQETVDLWAPDILCYRVRSLKHQGILGYIFLDLYQRPYKQITDKDHVMIIPAIRDDCSIACVGASVLVANFAKPKEQEPVLLTFDDVASLFHEMGHSLHALFGATRFTQFSGTQVMQDFVEAPAYMLDYWFDDPTVIYELSNHVKTGARMPKDIIEKLVADYKFDRVHSMLEQVYLGLVSLNLYMLPESHIDISKTIEKIYKKVFKHIDYEPENKFYATSIDLVEHDVAASYAYAWSQVIAANLIKHIWQQGGINNHYVGQQYVTDVLSHGGSKNPSSMLKRYLGKPFRREAFFSVI